MYKRQGIRPDVPYQCEKANTGSVLLLCTDGLYKQIEVCQVFDKALPIDGKYEDDASLIKIEL